MCDELSPSKERKKKKETLHRGPANTDVFRPLKLKCELFSFLAVTGGGDSLRLLENVVEREFGIIWGLYANRQTSLWL